MAEMPARIQLRRQPGWRLQETSRALNGLPAVRVSRPGLWGNYAARRLGLTTGPLAVEAYRAWVEQEASEAWAGHARQALRGRNLACWCGPDEPCHADILLTMANP